MIVSASGTFRLDQYTWFRSCVTLHEPDLVARLVHVALCASHVPLRATVHSLFARQTATAVCTSVDALSAARCVRWQLRASVSCPSCSLCSGLRHRTNGLDDVLT